MMKNLREAKARLSELVERAAAGEEVLITVRGKPRARLIGVPKTSQAEREAWIKELRLLRRKYSSKGPTGAIQQIMDEIREERF